MLIDTKTARWSDHFAAISSTFSPDPFQSSIKHTLSVIKGQNTFVPLHQKLTLCKLTFNEKAKQASSSSRAHCEITQSAKRAQTTGKNKKMELWLVVVWPRAMKHSLFPLLAS